MGRKKHRQKMQQQGQMNNTAQTPATASAGHEVKQFKEVPRLLTCLFKHNVTNTTAQFDWAGPKISPLVWNQVLAFFKWTYDTTKSESQVRLYVNTTRGEWAAWAFPQKANTGMTARELDTPEAQAQRAQFSSADGWLYFGTVHHHCSAGAFQSGTDEQNERSQDGIHITVGHMDRNQYQIHERFYLSGYKINGFSLPMIWNVTTPWREQFMAIPELLRPPLPADGDARVARSEMGVPPPQGFEFPEQWRTNLVFEAPVVHIQQSSGPFRHTPTKWNQTFTDRSIANLQIDLNRALDRVKEYVDETTITTEPLNMGDAVKLIADLATVLGEHHMNLMDIMCKNDVTPDNFLFYLEEVAEKALADGAQARKNGQPQQQQLTPPGGSEDQEYWQGM